jgi:hypothetical protein
MTRCAPKAVTYPAACRCSAPPAWLQTPSCCSAVMVELASHRVPAVIGLRQVQTLSARPEKISDCLERAACTRPRSPLGGDDGRVGQELPGIGALGGLLRLLLPRLLLGLRTLQLLLPLLFG